MHFINLVGGADPAATVSQVLFAGLLGVGFAALVLRTNALWLLVLLHGLFNLPSALGDKGAEASGFKGGSVIFGLLFALYAVFLLRRAKEEDLPAEAARLSRPKPGSRHVAAGRGRILGG